MRLDDARGGEVLVERERLTETIRELRNKGGEVVDRAAAGERIVITRDGRPVAELRPLAPRFVNTVALIEAWKHLPPVDVQRFRDDLDAVIDPWL